MMRSIASGICLGALLAATGAWAQTSSQSVAVSDSRRAPEATSPDYSAVYCSSFVTDEKVSEDSYLISGEQSNSKVVFASGDVVYINKGSNQGIRVGDRFSVIRPESDPVQVQWFKWQNRLLKAMGTIYRDKGQLRVTNVSPNVSTAEVTFSCQYMQRGDIIRPLQERPSPPYKPSSQFEHFAPVSGKSVGMAVIGHDFTQEFGKNSTIYINLGTNQGVAVGNYIRIFRFQGSHAETSQFLDNYQDRMLGFGSTPVRYQWNDLPREILGEGIVLNVSRNAATVFITYSRIEMFAGDYVEIE
jgi:hypothetical protein